MEHISEILSRTKSQFNEETKEMDKQLDPIICSVVDQLFGFFLGICRGFEKQYNGDVQRISLEKTQWVLAFEDCNLDSLEKIKFGIKKTRLESPTNTPTIGQFIKWCTPTTHDLNIPSFQDAYKEACSHAIPGTRNRQWSHEVVEDAAVRTGSFSLTHLSQKESQGMFDHNYTIAISAFNRKEKLLKIDTSLEQLKDKNKIEPGEEPMAYKVAMEKINEILATATDRRKQNKSDRLNRILNHNPS